MAQLTQTDTTADGAADGMTDGAVEGVAAVRKVQPTA